MSANETAFLDYNSDLIRKGWVKEGLVQNAAKSFWTPYTGSTGASVVYQKNMTTVAEGNTIIFDYDGYLTGEMALDREQAWGKGEGKRKFSGSLKIRRGRIPVNNGDKFNGKEIGDLSITEHGDSRRKLADLWTRHKDQVHFDAVQGRLDSLDNSHIFRPNDRATVSALITTDLMSYDYILELSEKMLEGDGFAVGSKRMPLKPFQTLNGEDVWNLMLDNKAWFDLRKDDRWQDLVAQGDIRGLNNFLFKGQPVRIGNLMVTVAPIFFGTSTDRRAGKTKPEIAGFRKLDEDGYYSGEVGFGAVGEKIIACRSVLLGAGALQYGMGMEPNYNLEFSPDHKITSESLLEVWFNVQKTQLLPETVDYDEARIGNMDYGVIAVDTYHSTTAAA